MAVQLAPVAEVVVDAAEPVSGLKTLDLACGTGNSALLEAERGAEVTGFDAATRLLEVAAGRAAEAGHEATWVEGDMQDLPFPDDSFEVITSVFGVIFGDPQQVAAEIARVLEPNGRIAITTWTNQASCPGSPRFPKRRSPKLLTRTRMQDRWRSSGVTKTSCGNSSPNTESPSSLKRRV
ncbi:MAG: class I SAM-dependent methyltransferase [Solirubrobacterales bacterium]|nr:class I SAM-dependent methyltransferase [Solirubrobacterales bacterium]